MDVHVVDHPLAKARLSTMRDARTDSAAFRAALHELAVMLVYEATRDLPVIVMTAKDLTDEDRQRLARTAEQVIHKEALRVDDLPAEIRGLLVTHRTRDGRYQAQEGDS